MQKAYGALELADPTPHARRLLAMIKAAVSAPDAAPVFNASEIAMVFAQRIEATPVWLAAASG